MATEIVNGVRLFCEVTGSGDETIVLVHGSWTSHRTWDAVVDRLSESFQIVRYDRRGHSDSERSETPGSVEEDAADLAALIEHLGLAPTWVAGSSFGASITLRFAVRRPDLTSGIILHEPPLFKLLADEPELAALLDETGKRTLAVAERIASGDHAGAAEQFVDTVALGPGSWERLPPDFQNVLVGNAPTFLDETNDPDQLSFDLDWVKDFKLPVLLTTGDQSPPPFKPIVNKLAAAIPGSDVLVFPGAGHIPYRTHPNAYVDAVVSFIQMNTPGK